jgi:hypothetical protein
MNRLMLLVLGVVVLAGCSNYKPKQPKAPPPEPAAEAPPAPSQAQPPVAAKPPEPAAAKPQEPAPKPAPPTVVEKKAQAGVGAKGHGYGSGPVATPVASYFNMKERIAFDIQIPEAMKLFKAMENRAPKTHQEYMEKIIKENHIKLPDLPEGHRYRYDPKTEQLMVEQPAPQ